MEVGRKVVPVRLLEDVNRWDFVDLQIFVGSSALGGITEGGNNCILFSPDMQRRNDTTVKKKSNAYCNIDTDKEETDFLVPPGFFCKGFVFSLYLVIGVLDDAHA
ncbi:hypothetical protein ZWY2020_025983 [Hordeum vulgare]|nr:hypothetical protein ZWY2020_025983 [Hordeum vulgare]